VIKTTHRSATKGREAGKGKKKRRERAEGRKKLLLFMEGRKQEKDLLEEWRRGEKER